MSQQPTKEHPIVQVSSRVVYENQWMKVREDKTLRDTGEGLYGVVETGDSVKACALNDKNQIFLIYAYSYPADTWSWQIPGGSSDGQDPVLAAKRELLEETGLESNSLAVLGNLVIAAGLLNGRTMVVLARDLELASRPFSDDRNSIKGGRFFDFKEVEEMIRSGDICVSTSISALYLVEKWINQNGN